MVCVPLLQFHTKTTVYFTWVLIYDTLVQESARAGQSTILKALYTSCLLQRPMGFASLCVSRPILTSARCSRYESRGIVSIETCSMWSLVRPFCSTRSTSWWVQGSCCSSTRRLCESTQTNSSALVTFVLIVSKLECRISLLTAGSELSEPLSEEYVDDDLWERIVSCWIANFMSSRPEPDHGTCSCNQRATIRWKN